MTNAQEAELRGEIFGLKVLVANLLSRAAGFVEEDRPVFFNTLMEQSIPGIAQATNPNVKAAYLDTFQAAALGVVQQLVDAARKAPAQAPPQRPMQ